MFNERALPVGIQDFEKLRTSDCLYVDKTMYIYQLTRKPLPYFLGRPRRFGKSLLLSTLKAYFLGKKELFDGLAIAGMEKEWIKYPVIYIDFNNGNNDSLQSVKDLISSTLDDYESEWNVPVTYGDLSIRFRKLIKTAYEKSGRKVVVLVDEYDKALVNSIDNTKLNDDLRNFFKGFYGVLKSADADLQFVFLTGVTKFSKVSVFSDLNHLTDISMDKKYAGICGISETELTNFLVPEIKNLAEELEKTYDETLNELRKRYNGYHFAKKSEGIYNPYSLLRTFNGGELRNYWFETGTPTFLVKMLKNTDLDIKSFEKDVKIPARSINDYRAENGNPLPLLYQSGYLTIKGYDERYKNYILGFPNEEVEYGFLNELLPAYMPKISTVSEFSVEHFIDDLQAGDVDSFMNRLRAFFADVPYDLENKTEKYFQTVFYLLFKLMGQFIEAEPHSAKGRADAVVVTDNTVYVFEFKITGRGTAETALRQIDDKGYAIPFTAGNKNIVKIGAEFDTDERGLKNWKKLDE
jgi:hypothetical protein